MMDSKEKTSKSFAKGSRLWAVVGLVVIVLLLFVFRSGTTEVPAASDADSTEMASQGKPTAMPSQSTSTQGRDSWLKRVKRQRTPTEKEAIAKKSEEVFERYLEVGMDIHKKEYEAALEKLVEFYTWTFENDFSSSKGVRSSFGLSEWKELVEAYPPAADKLQEMTDSLEEVMRTEEFADVKLDKATLEEIPPERRDSYIAQALMKEICNFNSVLKTPERGVALLAELLQNEPEVALASWRGAEDVLYETQSYDLLQAFIPDLEAEVAIELGSVQRVLSIPRPQVPGLSQQDMERMKRDSDRSFIQRKIGRILDFGIATGQTELVQELAGRVTEAFPVAEDLFETYR